MKVAFSASAFASAAACLSAFEGDGVVIGVVGEGGGGGRCKPASVCSAACSRNVRAGMGDLPRPRVKRARHGLLLARSLVDASSSFAPADREKCREDAAALADVLATDDLPLVRMDAALLLAAPIQAGDGVVQRLAGDDDPDVSEAGFNALKAREERVRDDSSCAVDFGSQSTNMDFVDPVEPADVEVVDDSAAAGAAVS